MTLHDSLNIALGLTRKLVAALAEERMDQCLDLLAQRGEALKQFEILHRQADDSQRRDTAQLVGQLQTEDQALQVRLNKALDATGTQLRQAMAGNGAQPPLPVSHGNTPGQFDRKC